MPSIRDTQKKILEVLQECDIMLGQLYTSQLKKRTNTDQNNERYNERNERVGELETLAEGVEKGNKGIASTLAEIKGVFEDAEKDTSNTVDWKKIIGYITDLERRTGKLVSEELERRKVKSSPANPEKSNFLGNMARDIRQQIRASGGSTVETLKRITIMLGELAVRVANDHASSELTNNKELKRIAKGELYDSQKEGIEMTSQASHLHPGSHGGE